MGGKLICNPWVFEMSFLRREGIEITSDKMKTSTGTAKYLYTGSWTGANAQYLVNWIIYVHLYFIFVN